MSSNLTVVDGYQPTKRDDTNLRDEVWALAMDQRAFGPRKLWVAVADLDGRFRGLAYTDRVEPLENAFEACLVYLGAGATMAVAFCDEHVEDDPTPPELEDRLTRMRDIAAGYGITLADWICCDDEKFRSLAGTPIFTNPRRARRQKRQKR